MKAIVYEGITDTRHTKDIINQGVSSNNVNDQSNTFDTQNYSSNIFSSKNDSYIKIILKP
ncbi:hypothetical protein [Clostridium tertium]|uniref:hypothetical protein n=1 Tax=Clostridium tertium TaxID=1559 RepID=UPI001AE1C60F|nr:hypothetical protein [Clostridium tertium]MBP1868217.1 hypothetical protein [Clostridium tertium]